MKEVLLFAVKQQQQQSRGGGLIIGVTKIGTSKGYGSLLAN